MRSSHADYFNHDESADGYDADVQDEQDPIRSGYTKTLDWVIQKAKVGPESRVLELGSGTGNLTTKILECEEIVCVDVSERMEKLALDKVIHLKNRKFIKDDVLSIFDREIGKFDAIISTYTIHHLTEDEKTHLFERICEALNIGGAAVFGDLMVESENVLKDMILEYKNRDQNAVAESLEEEFFWHLDESLEKLKGLGFHVEWKRISDLSFGIAAYKRRPNQSLEVTQLADARSAPQL